MKPAQRRKAHQLARWRGDPCWRRLMRLLALANIFQEMTLSEALERIGRTPGRR